MKLAKLRRLFPILGRVPRLVKLFNNAYPVRKCKCGWHLRNMPCHHFNQYNRSSLMRLFPKYGYVKLCGLRRLFSTEQLYRLTAGSIRLREIYMQMQATKSIGRFCLVVALVSIAATGCSRAFYRQQADIDAYSLIEEKSGHPHWDLQQFTIDVDYGSRMYDPFCKDGPPMPRDDADSHQLMHYIDGKRAFPKWHANGDTPYVENPVWAAQLPMNPKGVVELDEDGAVRMALLHSPDYQSQLETLYLSALDVSFERFRFDTQFFGGIQSQFTADGVTRGGGESSSQLQVGTFSNGPRGIGFQKLGATGTELIVGLANSIVWEFSGPDTQMATTLLDFALVQPLLRGAGRDRVLESLTVSERNLLANVRQMERFKRAFYVEIVTGRNAGTGPVRRTGTSAASFGTGDAGVNPGQVGGYLGLVQQLQQIRNQETNVAALRGSLAELEAYSLAGRINSLQVQQARQALYGAESRLISSKTNYETSLDAYKISLGLPPQLKVEISDRLVEPFNLVTPDILQTQAEIGAIQNSIGEIILNALGEDPGAAAIDIAYKCELDRVAEGAKQDAAKLEDGKEPKLAPGVVIPELPAPADPAARKLGKDLAEDLVINWDEDVAKEVSKLKTQIAGLESIRAKIVANTLPSAKEDIDHLFEVMDDRVADLQELRKRPPGKSFAYAGADAGQRYDVSPDVLDIEKLKKTPAVLRDALACLERKLADHPQSLANRLETLAADIKSIEETGATLKPDVLTRSLREKAFQPLPQLVKELVDVVQEIMLIQARARTETVRLPAVDVKPHEALEIARKHRRDWMNTRAALVDSWRLIEFNADELESSLNIVFSGDIGAVGDNPLNLQADAGRLRVGLQFDAPLNRLAERNTYRQALITYQQARRSYYRFEDGAAQGLRSILRNVELNQLNFELRREAIRTAIEQFELAQLERPPRPGELEAQQFGATTTRDLVSALNDLQSAQNDFLSVWLSYESLRRSLDLDLGIMQLTAEGIWLDPGPLGGKNGIRLPDACLQPIDSRSPLLELQPVPDDVLPQSQAPAGGVPEEIETPPAQVDDGEVLLFDLLQHSPPGTQPVGSGVTAPSVTPLSTLSVSPPTSHLSPGEVSVPVNRPAAASQPAASNHSAMRSAKLLSAPPAEAGASGSKPALRVPAPMQSLELSPATAAPPAQKLPLLLPPAKQSQNQPQPLNRHVQFERVGSRQSSTVKAVAFERKPQPGK